MKLRFTPSLHRDTTILEVSQAGETRRWDVGTAEEPPEDVPLTGQATILAHRAPLRTAPERVFFEVEVEGFDTPGPQGSAYDPRLHDLVYIWDFGDPGASYSAPVNVLGEWKDANVGFGPFVAHVYRAPGNYIVSVTVIEPGTGRTATAEFPVDVANPEDTFTGNRTIYVSQAGDFSAAPEGAMLIDDLAAALQVTRGGSPLPYRVMLKRGESWTWDHHWVGSDSASTHLVAEPGTGPRPVLRDDPNRSRNPFFTHRNTVAGSEFLYRGIAFVGGWDSTTETGYNENSAVLIETGARGAVMFDDCYISGMGGGIGEQNSSSMPVDMQNDKSVLVHDTTLTNWRSIGHFAVGASKYGFLGCAYVCDPAALAGGDKDGFHNEHGPIRFQPNFPHKVAIDGCDFFNRVGWAQNVPGIRTQQPCIRWNQNSVEGALLNMQRSSLEGGYTMVALSGVNADTVEHEQNLLVDRCLFVGSHMTRTPINIDTSGVTIRNCLVILPDVQRLSGIYETLAFVELKDNYNPQALSAPVRIYHNTVLNLMSDANSPRGDGSVELAIDGNGVPGLQVDNNLLHQPNIGTPDIDLVPLSDTLLWAPREAGYISEDQPTLLAQYATPADTVRLAAPLDGSPALGAALTGLVSYLDLYGARRPAYPSIGALERG